MLQEQPSLFILQHDSDLGHLRLVYKLGRGGEFCSGMPSALGRCLMNYSTLLVYWCTMSGFIRSRNTQAHSSGVLLGCLSSPRLSRDVYRTTSRSCMNDTATSSAWLQMSYHSSILPLGETSTRRTFCALTSTRINRRGRLHQT